MVNKYQAQLYLFLIAIITFIQLTIPIISVAKESEKVIPKEALRLRILANSNSEQDQQIKLTVRDVVNEHITTLVADLSSINKARQLIKAELGTIEQLAEEVLRKSEVDQQVTVELAKVAFPTKQYGQLLYPAGKYEAVVITLGKGNGLNWWCVLFPPLCFVDFSSKGLSPGFTEENDDDVDQQPVEQNMLADQQSSDLFLENDDEQVKVTFFIKELWQKIFN